MTRLVLSRAYRIIDHTPRVRYTSPMPIPASVSPSFLFYCYISAVTPGPANICSLSAALSRGKKAALQQWTGIFTGFFIVSVLSVFVAYFLGTALNEYVRYLSFVGAAYLLYLAIHTLRQNYSESERTQENSDVSAPAEKKSFFKNFTTGVLVQLTNVKIMLMCLTALSSYVLPYNRSFSKLLLVGFFLPFTGPVANLLWLFAGLSLQKLFENHQKPVNVVMALSLVLCAVSLVLSFFGSGA